MSACVSVWQLNAPLLAAVPVPGGRANRPVCHRERYACICQREQALTLCGSGTLGASARRWTAAWVSWLRSGLRPMLEAHVVAMAGRAEPFIEQRDEGGLDDYYLNQARRWRRC